MYTMQCCLPYEKTSNFAQHLLKNNKQPILNSRIKPIHISENTYQLTFLETLETKRYNEILQ